MSVIMRRVLPGARLRSSKTCLHLSRSLFGSPKQWKKESQSKVLGDVSSQVFELQVHTVKPEYTEQYLQTAEENMMSVSSRSDIPLELVGSWTTEIGSNLDQSIHLWRYKGGYSTMDEVLGKLKNDKLWEKYQYDLKQQITARSNQVLVAFTFWDPTALELKSPRGLYELRTYTLKPGGLIEWGHMWMQGIKYRKKEEAVGGWFSQIGEMHVVHHLWAYKNHVDRHETRQAAWEMPGWDECVLRTVPLIRHMEARIMTPTVFSPLQ